MIKLLVNRPSGRHFLDRWFCLPNPEHLGKLSRQQSAPGQSTETRPSADFSAIVSSLWVNGTQKLTARKRLTRTLQVALRHVDWKNLKEVFFLDIGASDASTTCEAVHFLVRGTERKVVAYALDRYTRMFRFDLGLLTEYRAVDGSPLLIRVGRFGMRLARPLAIPWLERFRRFYIAKSRFRGKMRKVREISLVHPVALSTPGVHLLEADALEFQKDLVNRIDLVRASNFLHMRYFSRREIGMVVSHVFDYLRSGGVFIVSRNIEADSGSQESGTAWRKEGEKFVLIESFGLDLDVNRVVSEFRQRCEAT